jgi:glycosyltransferase involved in cell wall biosynthesis
VVAVSNATREETVKLFRLDPLRVITVPNGVDVDRAAPRASRTTTRADLGIEDSAPVVISVGAFTEEKDPAAQVEVAKRIIERRRDAVFLMVGDGPLAASIKEAVHNAGLDRSIKLLGPRSDVADLLAACDVLLLASRTEGMPGVLIEAGIAGVPVAAYALAGVPEVVDEGRTGLLAPPGDIEALAASTLDLLDDGEARTSMGEAARLYCSERFDIRFIALRYLDLYRELAGARVPAGAAVDDAASMRSLEPPE